MKRNTRLITLIVCLSIAYLSCARTVAASGDQNAIKEVFSKYEEAVATGDQYSIKSLYSSENIMIIEKDGTPKFISRDGTASWLAGEGWSHHVKFNIKNIDIMHNPGLRATATVRLHRVTGADDADMIYILSETGGDWHIVAEYK